MLKKIIFCSIFVSLNSYSEEFNPLDFWINSDSHHNITLLNYSASSFYKKLELIENAKETIEVEYFIYDQDDSGKIFTQALLKKAKAGVKIKILLDYFMTKNDITSFMAHELEANGIEIKFFNPKPLIKSLGKGQYRNHRKLLLVDSKKMITGGRNIGNEYSDLNLNQNLLDREIFLEGPIVQKIRKTFFSVWDSNLSKKMERPNKPKLSNFPYPEAKGVSREKTLADALKYWELKIHEAKNFLTQKSDFELNFRNYGSELLKEEFNGTCDDVTFVSEMPIVGKENRKHRLIEKFINQKFETMQDNVFLETPYYISDSLSENYVKNALEKEKKITLLTNGLNSSDATYVVSAFENEASKLINLGANVYIFKGEKYFERKTFTPEIEKSRFAIHAKTFVFDQKDTIIGTYNMDPHSSHFNLEMVLACNNNKSLSKAVITDIKMRMDKSIELTHESSIKEAVFYNSSFFKKFQFYFFKIPSKVLKPWL